MNARLLTSFKNIPSIDIIAKHGNQPDIFPEPCQILADISTDTAHGHMQFTGIGVMQDIWRMALPVYVHIGSADSRNIRHVHFLFR